MLFLVKNVLLMMVQNVLHVYLHKTEKFQIKSVFVKWIITNLIILILVLNVLNLVIDVKIMEMELNVFNAKQEITEMLIVINSVNAMKITINNYHHLHV